MKICKLILFLIFFALISTAAWAAATPAIFYSDLTSGPGTGGQNNEGVFVTIWGNNFGSSQGSSTVTVGGGAAYSYETWTNTEICFQIGSSAKTGNIVVTTSGGASNTIPFTVRNGNIYFVNPSAGTNGTGTYASPFNQMYYAYALQTAGDTTYVETGTITDVVNGHTGWHGIMVEDNSGTSSAPIAWVAYPNDTVTLKADGGTDAGADGGGSDGDVAGYIFRADGGNWITISKFTMQFTGSSGNLNQVVGAGTGWRVVGNNISATYYNYGEIDFGGGSVEILGNTIHDSGGSQAPNNENHSIYIDGPNNPFEVGWNYMYNNQNIGWEISSYHNGPRIGTIHDNMIIANSAGSDKGILIGGAFDSGDSLSTTNSDVEKVYNNVLVNLGQTSNGGAIQGICGTGYIYNNTIYGSGTEGKGMVQLQNDGCGPTGGDSAWSVANNILYGNVSGLYISDGNGNNPTWGDFTLLSNNNYYGEGNGPTEDPKAINANPQFVSPSTSVGGNFQLQSSSPDINAGYNVLSVVVNDLLGILRSATTMSIGAYQYGGSSSVLPSSPVVAITSPTSGSSYTAGSNVTVTTTASETNGNIANISLYNGSGLLLGSSSTSPYTFVDTNMAAGGYSFYAVAKDTTGVSTTSSTTTITVTSGSSTSTSAPVVAIASPASGSTYQQGSTFTITSSASETNGSIAQVQYYTGSYLLASSSTPPYTASWTNATTGSFTLTAKATDAKGVSTMSNPITITVSTTPSGVAPSITAQPASVTVTAPATVTFSVAASGTPAPTYQWMQSVNGGGFSNIAGATSSSYTTAATSTANSGTQFECVVTNASGSVTSNAATLTVNTATKTVGTPVVTITSPANGSTYLQGSTFTVTASASETNGTIAQVQYYSGSALLATDTTYPYSASWTNATTGTFTLTAKATDANGVSTMSSPITITVTSSSSSPVVSITSPANGNSYTAGSNLTMSANASETNGTITGVYFYNGTTYLGSDSSSPYNFTWTNVPAGTYNLIAVAIDAKGVSVTSNAVTVTVTASTTAQAVPVVSISSPSNGSSFTQGSTFTITSSASETNGTIAQIQYYSGSALLATATKSPYTATWTNATTGTFTVTAKATDANGVSTTSSPITITVTAAVQTPSTPIVSITSPTSGTKVITGSTITINVSASETNGTISQVRFYNGTTLLYTVYSSPYSYSWAVQLLPGTYNISAQATDNNGVTATSSTVPITVAL